MKQLYPELAAKEMKEGKRHGESKVTQLLRLFPDGLTAKAIAVGVGWQVKGVRPYLTWLKKRGRICNDTRGVWKLATPAEVAKTRGKDKPVCPTCNNRRWLEVNRDGKISYKPCPDCTGLSGRE